VLAPRRRFVRPILGHYGGADEGIPVGQVEELGRALSSAGVSHEIHVYPNATHSFFDRRHEEFAAEADQAWRRTIAFLGRTLAASPAD
jgi:carboxymethylenebutenolidase